MTKLRKTEKWTFSLTLVHYTLGRRGATSLGDLDGLSGVVGRVGDSGELVPFKRADGAEPGAIPHEPQERGALAAGQDERAQPGKVRPRADLAHGL